MNIAEAYSAPEVLSKLDIPYFFDLVPAGYPSISDGIADTKDINDLIIKNPTSTFYIKVQGDSMKDRNINSGDLLVIDKSLVAKDGSIVLAVVNSEFTVKVLRMINDRIILEPANEKYKPVEITDGMTFSVWGVVTYAIHKSR